MATLPPIYNSIKEIGGYDQLSKDAKDQLLQLPNIRPEAIAKAQAAMAEKLEDPATQTQLIKEVTELADSALKVDEAFERVRIGLGKVDKNDYKDKNGVPIPKYQPIWVGFQKRWTDLLWGSRDVATKTEAYINDFLNVIVPSVEAVTNAEEKADAILDLDGFINQQDPFGKKLNSQETIDAAQKYSQDFTDLRRDLDAFKNTFDAFAKDHEVALGTQITDKENKITQLNVEIKGCETVVAAMGIALGVTVFATAAGAVGALVAFGPLGPAVAVGVIIVGVVAALTELGVLIAYLVKTSELKKERAGVQRELDDLKEQLENLKNLKAILDSQKNDIQYIAGRLDRFAAIWAIVRHDAATIRADLDTVVGVPSSVKTFKNRVDLIKKSYVNLAAGLNLYATQVSKSKTAVAPTPAPK